MSFERSDENYFPSTRWNACDFEMLLDCIPAGVVIYGTDSRAVYPNRCAHRLLGGAIDLMREFAADSGVVVLLRPDGSALPRDDNPVPCVLRTGRTVHDAVVGLPGPYPPLVNLQCLSIARRGRTHPGRSGLFHRMHRPQTCRGILAQVGGTLAFSHAWQHRRTLGLGYQQRHSALFGALVGHARVSAI